MLASSAALCDHPPRLAPDGPAMRINCEKHLQENTERLRHKQNYFADWVFAQMMTSEDRVEV